MATAEGESLVSGAEELRVKETDRIRSMTENLSKMGARIRVKENSLFITGPVRLRGAHVHSFKDHRTAMSLAVAGLIAEGETVIEDVDCIQTSFPGFFEMLKQAGAEARLA